MSPWASPINSFRRPGDPERPLTAVSVAVGPQSTPRARARSSSPGGKVRDVERRQPNHHSQQDGEGLVHPPPRLERRSSFPGMAHSLAPHSSKNENPQPSARAIMLRKLGMSTHFMQGVRATRSIRGYGGDIC